MRRTRILSLSLVIFVVLALAGAPLLFAQETQAPPAKPAGQQGTGVVPPGVKLVGQEPAGASPRPYQFPQAATKTLENGIRVFVISNAEQPAVTVRLVLPAAGAIHDPAAKPGVAQMTADLLTQGTATRSAQQIAEAIDFVGGTLDSSADSDGTYVRVTVVKKDLDLGLELLADVTRNASFKEEELERRRQQSLSGLRIQYSDASYLASAILTRVVYGSHPYGLPEEGTPDSVRALTRDDLVTFRDAWYSPQGALLAFAGDISPEAAFALAQKYLGDWKAPSASKSAAEPAAPTSHKGMHILLVDKPDAVQTEIRVGHLGIPRSSADYVPLLVTNRIFGGGYNSRLSTEVRIRKGLTYGAYSNFDARREAGSFVASTATRTETTVEAARVIVNLLDKMATGEVTPAEMNFARDYLAGVFPIQTETPEQVAGRVLTVAQYGLPADYNDTYQQHILGISPEQVKTMSAKYFATTDLDLVLVGNVEKFRDALKKEFPNATYEEMRFDQVDLLAPDLRHPAESAAPPSPEALAHGKALLEAAVEAAGAATAEVKSVEATGVIHFTSPRGEMDAGVKLQAVLASPGGLRAEVQMPFGTIVQGYDGTNAWMAMGPRTRDLPPEMSGESERDLLLLGALGLYRQVQAGQAEAAFTGEEDVEGQKLLAAEWNAPSGKVKLYFDPQSRVVAGARYMAFSPQGPSETLELWSDFREVPVGDGATGPGVKVPFHSVTFQDGAKFAEQTLKEVKLNVPVDPALFSKPATP